MRSGERDFRPLFTFDPAYAAQQSIPVSRTIMLRDLVIRLRFRIPSVIRYLGQDYVGDHLSRTTLLKRIKPLVDSPLFKDIARALTQRSPALLKGESSSSNFWDYKRYGNHTSVTADIDRTIASINKEEHNRFLLTFSNWLARFIPHLHLTPSGLVVKLGKKDRLIFGASFAVHHNSEYVNNWTNKANESPLVFPKALLTHLTRIYNLRISYPHEEILLWDDKISSTFCWVKLNPEITTAFSFSLSLIHI